MKQGQIYVTFIAINEAKVLNKAKQLVVWVPFLIVKRKFKLNLNCKLDWFIFDRIKSKIIRNWNKLTTHVDKGAKRP